MDPFILCSIFVLIFASLSNGNSEIPKIVPFNPFINQPKHSTFYLTCNVISRKSSLLKLKWLFNKIEIGTNSNVIRSDRYSIRNEPSVSMFILHDVEPSDSGNYSCVVSSPTGASSLQTTFLQVNGSL